MRLGDDLSTQQTIDRYTRREITADELLAYMQERFPVTIVEKVRYALTAESKLLGCGNGRLSEQYHSAHVVSTTAT